MSVEEIQNFFLRLFKKNVRIIDVHQVQTHYSLIDLFEKDIVNYDCSINNKTGEYIDNIIILFIPVVSEYFGHYQLIAKHNSKIYFFDSYGDDYVHLVEKVNKTKAVFISDNFGKLVINTNLEISINKYKYQTNASEDSTCGFHSSICGFFFLVSNEPNFTKYNDFISKYTNKNTSHSKYDSAVLYLFKNLQLK